MMRRISIGVVFAVFFGLFWVEPISLLSEPRPEFSEQQTAEPRDNGRGRGSAPHQLGQATFRSVLPEEVDWKRFPAFPSVRFAVAVGEPSTPHPYMIRVKVPSGVMLMPHKHPEDRLHTVLSGVFYIGLGEKFEAEKLNAYPPGSVVVLPGNTFHYHWAKSGEYVAQVTAVGPFGPVYRNPEDDPRNNIQGATH